MNDPQSIGRNVLSLQMLRDLEARMKSKPSPTAEILLIEKSDGAIISPCVVARVQCDRDSPMILHLEVPPLSSAIGPQQLLKMHRHSCCGDYSGEYEPCDFYRVGDTHISVIRRSGEPDTAETPQDNHRSPR